MEGTGVGQEPNYNTWDNYENSNSVGEDNSNNFLPEEVTNEILKEYKGSTIERDMMADRYFEDIRSGNYHPPPPPSWPNLYTLEVPLTGAQGGTYILVGTAAFATGWFAPEVYAAGAFLAGTPAGKQLMKFGQKLYNYVRHPNAQRTLDFISNFLPSAGVPNRKSGAVGVLAGKIVKSERYILNP